MSIERNSLFTAVHVPSGIERVNHISAGREEISHDTFLPKPGEDIPVVRVIGCVNDSGLKTAKDGRTYTVLSGAFVAVPVETGPVFAPIRSGVFIPPDCVAGEISFSGCLVDLVILKRFNAKSPARFSFVVLFSPEMDNAIASTRTIGPAEDLKALGDGKPARSKK